MHPQLLHQLADDSVIERSRHHHTHRGTEPAGRRASITSRLRMRTGGLLIAVGTRVAGPRPTAVLHHHTSVPS